MKWCFDATDEVSESKPDEESKFNFFFFQCLCYGKTVTFYPGLGPACILAFQRNYTSWKKYRNIVAPAVFLADVNCSYSIHHNNPNKMQAQNVGTLCPGDN